MYKTNTIIIIINTVAAHGAGIGEFDDSSDDDDDDVPSQNSRPIHQKNLQNPDQYQQHAGLASSQQHQQQQQYQNIQRQTTNVTQHLQSQNVLIRDVGPEFKVFNINNKNT